MSLAINVDRVEAVCVGGQWHEVADQSFDLDAYEFHHEGHFILRGGTVEGVPSGGYGFRSTDGHIIVGPVTAIQAIRLRSPDY